MLLLDVVSLVIRVIRSNIGVPMSPGYGGYQVAMPPFYYITSATKYATTIWCNDVPKYYSERPSRVCCPSLLHRGTQVLICSKLLPNRGSCLLHHQRSRVLLSNYAPPDYCTEAPKYYTISAHCTTISCP